MEDIFLKEMGKRVSTRRKSLSLTQEALAEKDECFDSDDIEP